MEPKADAKEVAAPAAVKSDTDAKEDAAPAAVEAEAAADAAAEPPVSEVKAEEGGDPEAKEGGGPEGAAAADGVKPEEAAEAAASGDKDETWWRSLETPAVDAAAMDVDEKKPEGGDAKPMVLDAASLETLEAEVAAAADAVVPAERTILLKGRNTKEKKVRRDGREWAVWL